MAIKQAPSVAFQVIDGRAVLVTPRKNTIHYMNEIGTDIWNYIAEERTENEIISFIQEAYEVDEATAKSDVMDFIQKLESKGLLEIKQ